MGIEVTFMPMERTIFSPWPLPDTVRIDEAVFQVEKTMLGESGLVYAVVTLLEDLKESKNDVKPTTSKPKRKNRPGSGVGK